MLDKLRYRGELDVPTSNWRVSPILLLVLGGLAFLFVLGPLGGAALKGLLTAPLAVVVGGASAVIALLAVAVLVRRYRTAA